MISGYKVLKRAPFRVSCEPKPRISSLAIGLHSYKVVKSNVTHRVSIHFRSSQLTNNTKSLINLNLLSIIKSYLKDETINKVKKAEACTAVVNNTRLP